MSFDFTHRNGVDESIERSRRRNAPTATIERTPPTASSLTTCHDCGTVGDKRVACTRCGAPRRKPERQALPTKAEAWAAFCQAAEHDKRSPDVADFERWWIGRG